MKSLTVTLITYKVMNMKQMIFLIALLPLISLISSCENEHANQKSNKVHHLINPDSLNTFAFLGNSITHDGRYHSYLELFLLTRYPDADFEFINAGVAGDQAGIALQRLDDDLLVHKPDVVTVMFGMNDIGRNLYGRENLTIDSMLIKQQNNIVRYTQNIDSIIYRLLDGNAEVMLFTPSIYEQNAHYLAADNKFGCNDALEKCANIIKSKGNEHNLSVVDIFTTMDSLNNLLQETWPDTTLVSEDRVHPQDIGHFVMAYAIIKDLALHQTIAKVTLNAKKNTVKTQNAEVSAIKNDNGELSFSYKPVALPFPTNELEEIAELLNFNERFNREILKIKNLNAGNYSLTIEDKAIGDFSEEQLNLGINLSEFNTPQKKLSMKIAQLNEEKRKLISNELRTVAFIEYFFAPAVRTINDQQQVIEFLRNKSKKANNDWITSQIEKYFEVKKNHSEIVEKINQLNQEINELRLSIPTYAVTLKLKATSNSL